MHDSTRLQSHTAVSPRNPFRHLKRQRKHHSLRPSHQATQHAQKQATQQTTQQTRRPHSRHVPDGCCRENHVVKRVFVKICPSPPFRSLLFHSMSRTYGLFSVRCDCSVHTSRQPVAPVAYQVILEPGIGQFRVFEPRRVHTRINSLGLFLVDKLTCGKRENVS